MAGSRESGLVAIKEKISVFGVDLKAWGATKTKPEVEAIKQLQNQFDSLNRADYIDASQAGYLEVSKKLDDLLLKQEIYWEQWSRVAWQKHGDKNANFFFIQKHLKGKEETI